MRESMEIYPITAMERAMKLQEVLLRATSGKIKWWQVIGISERFVNIPRSPSAWMMCSSLWTSSPLPPKNSAAEGSPSAATGID